MIEIKKYKAKHEFKTYWNKYAMEEQYTWIEADCFCVYFLGILIYKRLESPTGIKQ